MLHVRRLCARACVLTVARLRAVALAVSLMVSYAQSANAQSELPRLAVELSPELPLSAQQALRAALSAQASEVLLSVAQDGVVAREPVVKVGRADQGFALGFFDASGQLLGEPRVVQGLDDVSASEVATIVHALAVAWRESAPAASEPSANAEATAPAQPVDSAAPKAANESSAQLSKPVPTGAKKSAQNKPIVVITPAKKPLAERPVWSERDEQLPATKSVAADRLVLSAMYTGSNQAKQLPWHSGARAELTYRFASPFYAGLGYAHLPTTTLSMATATFSYREHALSAFVGGRRRFGWLELGSDIALAGTLSQRATGTLSSELQATPDAQSWRPSVTWRVRARLPLGGSRFAVDIAPAVAINLTRRQMTIHDANESAVLTPYWLQSRVDLGISYSAL